MGKYVALATSVQSGSLAVWVDLDVYLPADPTKRIRQVLAQEDKPTLAFASFLTSQSLSPSIVAATGDSSEVLMRYARWLFEHPYILDHQGWDSFLQNPRGDFSGGRDYKGRNITSAPDDGIHLSFALPARSPPPRYAVLPQEFASGDGWRGEIHNLATFHFLGAKE